MPWPHFTPRKHPVPILQEAEWAPGLVWMGGKSRPHQDSILDKVYSTREIPEVNYIKIVWMKCAFVCL